MIKLYMTSGLVGMGVTNASPGWGGWSRPSNNSGRTSEGTRLRTARIHIAMVHGNGVTGQR